MTSAGPLKLPSHYELEPELREQLGSRPGHQRCIDGHGELLLVVHEVPAAGVPERQALFFWKRHDGRWTQPGGPGINELGELLDRYEAEIDRHEEVVERAAGAEAVFTSLRHSAPMARSLRNLVHALEQTLFIDSDDREIRNYRDRAREIERAAELLHADARVTLEFFQAQRAEQQALAGKRLGRIAHRLNLLAAFFLPLVALGALLGMNVELPGFVQSLFWAIFAGGMILGAALVWLACRNNTDI